MSISEHTRRRWSDQVQYLLDHAEEMTDWEVEFVDSMEELLSRGADLSMKQSFKLRQIYDDVQEEVG